MCDEKLLLVDIEDNIIGEIDKLEAHKKGLLHRAFSGFIFNNDNELLIQKRAPTKYHNPNIWSNTVCSHPRKNESIEDAVKRRCFEELGFYEDFKDIGYFIYKSNFSNGLIEHELDHVCVAYYSNSKILINKNEVFDFKWISRKNLEKEILINSDSYSFWLKRILDLGIIDNFYN